MAVTRRFAHLPNDIQSVLKLDHDPNGCRDHGSEAEQRCDKTLSGPTCIRQHRLNRFRTGVPKHVFDRGRHPPADGLLTEEASGNGDGDDNDWSKRENRIIGESRALSRNFMAGPICSRLF
jgi:hypothetical protein